MSLIPLLGLTLLLSLSSFALAGLDGDGMPDDWNDGKSEADATSDPVLVRDNDDDNDGVFDISDAFPLNFSESVDTDRDGVGVGDNSDVFPTDASETVDTDSDGTGNNANTDDDGVADALDAFPLDVTQTVDTDSDGTGNNADANDDGDGVLDIDDESPLTKFIGILAALVEAQNDNNFVAFYSFVEQA